MRQWIRRWLEVVVVTAIAGNAACLYTEQAKVIAPVVLPFKGEYRFDPNLKDHPPQSIAVLPFLNRTDKKEAFEIVRQSFQGHFSKLNFSVLPLFKVDHALRQAGLDTPDKVAVAPPQRLREILKTDAVIRGEVTHFDRVYAGVYSQVAVGAEVKMLDGKTAKELWWAKNVSRKHGGGVAVTPVGLILTAAITALNMREIELLRSSDDLFRDMVKTVPQPALFQALRPPNITILAHDGMRRTDRYALKSGDLLKVAMEGDPGKKAFFRIGDFKREIPLREEEPGNYVGSYKVLPGDEVSEALITGTLTDDVGNSTEWVDALGVVTIDTIPPGIPGELKGSGRDKAVELRWAKGAEEDIARYKVYRSPTPLSGFEEAGTTELTVFHDRNLANGTSYYYKISALDLAGNESRLSKPVRATAVAPGPTPVTGTLAGETTWYTAASPYLIEREVVVEAEGVLTIEPGTVIRSKGEGLYIKGTLIARGEPQRMIVFEPATADQGWKGIAFEAAKGEESALEYARISGADVGVRCVSSSPRVGHNDVSRNQTGVQVSNAFSQPRIYHNVIAFNSSNGVEVLSGARPELEENEIRGNGRDGITIREGRVSLQKNRIFRNAETGVRLFSSAAVLRNNSLHDNGTYEIYNSLERDIPVDALENWWGSREGLRIVERIYGRVNYGRILESPEGKAVELSVLSGPLGGRIVQDSFLIQANSPYLLERELVVDEKAMLFIQPGVTLKFNPGASIVVQNGGIHSRGTAERWITFTSSGSSPVPGSYPSAVRFEQESGLASLFRYCIFELAETALDIAHGSPEIDHCLITRNAQAGIRVSRTAAPKISFSTFLKNAGTGGLVALGSSRPTIQKSNFQENPFAIQSHSSIYFDARNNWWGTTPPSADLLLGEINFKPWLEAPEPDAFSGRRP